MTAVTPLPLVPEPADAGTDRADRLRSLLREDFLAASGWDPVGQVFGGVLAFVVVLVPRAILWLLVRSKREEIRSRANP